jgi:hypothetical protein
VTKPHLFIASSSEHLAVLEAAAQLLHPHFEIERWDRAGQIKLGRNIFDWARGELQRCDFGLFVLAPDSRWGGQPNGNVLLEMGLLAGRLEPQRAMVLAPEGWPIPADLGGRIFAPYDAEAFQRNGADALAAPCKVVVQAARDQRTLIDEVSGLWLETKKVSAPAEGPLTLLQFARRGGRAQVRGRSYDRQGASFVDWPLDIDRCWEQADKGRIYQAFDAHVGATESGNALGLNSFRFEADRRHGAGFYVVHGGGDAESGTIAVTLRRVTPDLLAGFGLPTRSFTIDDLDACAALVAAALRRLAPAAQGASA